MKLDPNDILSRWNLGNMLIETGRIVEAAEQFERGLALPHDAPQQVEFRRRLRLCYALSGDTKALDVLWRRSIDQEPPNLEDWDGYAEFCLYQGRLDDYRIACRSLIEHFGTTKDAKVAEMTGRACLLSPASGEQLASATALIDCALADKKPGREWAVPYFMVAKGLAEYRHGRLERAIAIMDGPASTALQAAPRLVSAMARHRLGREEEALRTFAAAILATDWRKSKAVDREHWIYHVLRREAEAMMLPNLPAFLEGKYRPRTNDERLCLLGACQFEGRYLTAAELYAEILTSDPHIADNLKTRIRYLAAFTAAMAGAGCGQDAVDLDESGRLRWRRQARDWLGADLEIARKLSKVNAGGIHEFVKNMLKNWSTDPDLAGLRDRDACKGLLPAEQNAFQGLCEELRILANETKH